VTADRRRTLLLTALRLQAGHGAHAELARQVVLFLLFAELVGGAAHGGPPHAAWQAPSRDAGPARTGRRLARSSLAGRRPRG
jgi:hypothetical protein